MIDLLTCSNIVLVSLVLPFCKIKVSYHAYLQARDDGILMFVDFVKLNDEVQRWDEKSGGNNYYKYLAVLSFYGCAGHILTSIVTR